MGYHGSDVSGLPFETLTCAECNRTFERQIGTCKWNIQSVLCKDCIDEYFEVES